MKVEFMRDGESREGTYALPAMGSERLVPNHAPRQYIVWGGLVFIALSEPYLVSEFEQDFYASAPLSLLNAYYHGRREADGGRQEVVVLAQVLSSSGNAGYEDARAVTLHTINGQAVRSLAHAAELLDAAEADGNGEYVQFETDHKDLIILSKAVAAAESAALLETHAIPAPRLLAGR
jgi:enamine deaminase RidA (YjgF/YER057c/UK114 family)